jgi:hypothetical protein
MEINRKSRCQRHRTVAIAITLLGTALPVSAEQPASISEIEALTKRLDEETRKLEALRESLDEKQKALRAQRRALDALQRDVQRATSKPPGRLSEEAQSELRGGQATPGAQGQPGAQGAAPPATVGQAPEPSERRPNVAPVQPTAGVLTPRNALVLEPSLQYSYSTNNRVAIVGFSVIPALVIGLVDVRTINRTAWVAALTGRYGLTDRMEVELRVPYVYRSDSTVARPFNVATSTDSVFNAQGQGIGDVELATRYQFNDGGIDNPYYIGGLRVRFPTGKNPFEVQRVTPFAGADQLDAELPTGSGFYAVQPSFTMLFPSDPAVFFASVLYLHNFPRDFGAAYGTIDPGDIPEFNFGIGLSLNERASFSVAYDHSILTKPRQNGVTPPLALTTQLGQLLFGYSYRLSPKTTLNLSLAVGVTQDAPNVQLTLRIPIRAF